MAAYRWKSFNDDVDRPEKPRKFGVTEMNIPGFGRAFSQGVLQVCVFFFDLFVL